MLSILIPTNKDTDTGKKIKENKEQNKKNIRYGVYFIGKKTKPTFQNKTIYILRNQ